MKKVLMSLFTIAVVGALVTGATMAYFSDTETSELNKFQSGTIDFEMTAAAGGPVEITLTDMKPCDWAYYTVRLTNVGTNDGPVYLHFEVGDGYDVVLSEPEDAVGGGAINNIEDHITVDLVSVDTPNYVIISEDDHVKLADLDCKWIPLGWFGGGAGSVKEFILSFHLQADTGNEYQGDAVDFTIETYMTDHNAPPPDTDEILLFLENKDASWVTIGGDGIWGYVLFDPQASTFDYAVECMGLTPGTNYSFIYYPEPQTTWPWPITVIDSGVAAGDTSLSLSGSYDFGQDLNQVKLWVVVSSDIVAGEMSGWNPGNYLFETILINYDDTDV